MQRYTSTNLYLPNNISYLKKIKHMKHKSILITALVWLLFVQISNAQWGDYTLYSGQNSTSTQLIDHTGAVYHSWTHTSATKTGYSSYLLPGGTLLRTISKSGNQFTGGPICGEVQKVDWNGNVTWDFVYSTYSYCSHHDICAMPNGNVLLIAYERKTSAEAIAAGVPSISTEMWPDKIVEIQPTGATSGVVVWEWKAWDHLVQNVDATKANYQTSIVNHPELLNINYKTTKDWIHMNGLDYNPMLDQITFTSHNLNEIYVIDHSTTTAEAASHAGGNSGKGGDILYRWGNPLAYGAGTIADAVLNVTHDAHWIPEGSPNAGRLAAFNNKGVSNTISAVDMFDVPRNNYNYDITLGQAYIPATYSQRITCQGGTSNMGNSQQLPNGNILYTVALQGKMVEVDAAGTTVWTKTISGVSIPQSFRYENCYINNAAPAIPAITQNNNDLSSTSGASYQWYVNGTLIAGATNQTLTPTLDGIYVVRTTDSNGCVYVYSPSFHFTLATSLKNQAESNQKIIYPNPSSGLINVQNNGTALYNISVNDVYGKRVYDATIYNSADLSFLSDGVYFITLAPQNGFVSNQKIIIKK